jgi:hypothetical protein
MTVGFDSAQNAPYQLTTVPDNEELSHPFDRDHFTIIDKLEHTTALSIGIGADIKQNIARDVNDPRIWNTADAKLVNIQVINSVAFESITRMRTPPTPVCYQTYIKAGLPFYDVYQEQFTSFAGDFSKVRTISEVDAEVGSKLGVKFDPLQPTVCKMCLKTYVDTM